MAKNAVSIFNLNVRDQGRIQNIQKGVARTLNSSIQDTFYFSFSIKTVFDAILTSRQTWEKLQRLYENLMSNNFRKKAVLKKSLNCKLKLHS